MNRTKNVLGGIGFAILLVGLMALATSAEACTAFLSGERTSGMNKICFYDHLGSDYAITVGAVKLCPLTVTARH